MNYQKLIVQPNDGVEPILNLLRSASKEILVKQFTFDHPAIMNELLESHSRGVDIRIMLNSAKVTGERINDASFEKLKAAGILVNWTCPSFLVTHEKTVIVDGEFALIATFNFMEKYFSQTRDYGIIISDLEIVAQMISCFDSDWHRDKFIPSSCQDIAWSPGTARTMFCDAIDSAGHTIDIQHPKFAEPVIFERIHAAIKRGVKVRFLCGGKHGLHQPDLMYSFAFWRLLNDVGAKVHKQKQLRCHAKLIIIDRQRALLSTQNLDQPAFDVRREVGIMLHSSRIIQSLEKVYEEDWINSRSYAPPYPICSPEQIELEEFRHDPELQHI